jgi:lipid A ethanolaminephosphotransferase
MHPLLKTPLHSSAVSLLFCIILTLLYNSSLWTLIFTETLPQSLFFLSFFVFVVSAFNLLLACICFKWIQKPVLISIILVSAGISYFMQNYGVVFDKNMIQNIVETDSHEALDLINASMLIHLALYGIIPALIISRIRISYARPMQQLKRQALVATLSVITLVAAVLPFYKTYSSLFRNHREVRHLLVPSNALYYGARYLSGAYNESKQPLVSIGLDAKKEPIWDAQQKPGITIVVVGETARAANFALNGYPRDTNPQLQQQDIINFSQVASCGTSTAVSLPCMFSDRNRANYNGDRARSRENVLDVIERAGIDVVWRDNNSGCKGVCDRINKQGTSGPENTITCLESECFDDMLLDNLDQYLAKNNGDTLIVLHQKGSHGPAYDKRYPDEFSVFQPACKTGDLQRCSRQEIINAYDNSIRYTDHFLSKVIDYLKARQQTYTTAMLYVSDHGESLGEGNVFLHGLPYFLAPDEQKHVPMIMWLSEDYQTQFHVSKQCLADKASQSLSHDNLYHSLLGLMAVDTDNYTPNMDIISQCQTAGQPLNVIAKR